MNISRLVGVQHRVKQTKEGAAHPTRLFIRNQDGSTTWLHMATEDDERDFVLRRLPTAFAKVETPEDLDRIPASVAGWKQIEAKQADLYASQQLTIKRDGDWWTANVPLRHIKVRAIKDDEVDQVPSALIMTERKGNKVKHFRIIRVPTAFDGLRPGDVVVTLLGGSGGNFIGSLCQMGEAIGAQVWRTPPFRLKTERGESTDKSRDAQLLVEMFEREPELFYHMRPADRELVTIGELYDLRREAQKQRIAMENQLRQQAEGEAFRNLTGDAGPVGDIAYAFDQLKASDAGFGVMKRREGQRTRELDKAMKASVLFQFLSGRMDLAGVAGASVMGRLLPQIGDILAFEVSPDEAAMEETREREEAILARLDMANLEIRASGVLKKGMNPYQRMEAIRRWARENGMHAVADTLTEAIDVHRARGRMRQNARNRTRAKLRRFCGVDVRRWGDYGDTWPHEQLPRFRSKERFRGNPLCRQALYDLYDVVLRKKNSPWNKLVVKIKAELRRKHPTKLMVLKSLAPILRRVEQVVQESGVVYTPLESYRTLDDIRSLLEQARHALEPERFDQISAEIDEQKVTGKEMISVFSDGHIHNMARWRLASKFVDALTDSWLEFARKQKTERRAAA